MIRTEPYSRSAFGKLGAIALVLALGVIGHPAAAEQLKPAVPIDPIAGIMDAFHSYRVVALGEGNHHNIQGHLFRLSLLRDRRFAQTVNDIVLECGNALYQDTIDRFVRGKEVPYAELRKVWEDVSEPQAIWDVPIYEEFYRAVRDVNASLPKNRRIRVLLGETPFDWDRVQSFDDIRKQPHRSDEFTADLVEREVLAKKRRALIIQGEFHFLRKPVYYFQHGAESGASLPNGPTSNTIVSLLERRGYKVFSIWANTAAELTQLQPDIGSWSPPNLAIIANTPLGRVPLGFYTALDLFEQFGIPGPDGKVRIDARADEARSGLMQEQFDAVLNLGPPSSITYSGWSRELCADESYLRMRFRRLEVARMDAVAAAGKHYCEELLQQK